MTTVYGKNTTPARTPCPRSKRDGLDNDPPFCRRHTFGFNVLNLLRGIRNDKTFNGKIQKPSRDASCIKQNNAPHTCTHTHTSARCKTSKTSRRKFSRKVYDGVFIAHYILFYLMLDIRTL